MSESVSRKVWNVIATMKIGDTFTTPDLRKAYFPKISYSNLSSAIAYLSDKKNLVRRTNTWTGFNHIIWEVVDNSLPPSVSVVSWPKKSPSYISTAVRLGRLERQLSQTLAGKFSLETVSTDELLAEMARRSK